MAINPKDISSRTNQAVNAAADRLEAHIDKRLAVMTDFVSTVMVYPPDQDQVGSLVVAELRRRYLAAGWERFELKSTYDQRDSDTTYWFELKAADTDDCNPMSRLGYGRGDDR